MRKLILPAITAAAFAFLPAQAHASWLSEAIHQARGDYDQGYYGSPAYAPSYGYSGYSQDYYNYTPRYNTSYYYSPPAYNYSPRYYAAPAYSGYSQGYYDSTPYYNYTPRYQPYIGSYNYPQYRYEGRDRDRHEWREHEEREEHEEHERYEHRR